MTTIACDGRTLVADTRATEGTISSHVSKLHRFKHGYVAIAGDVLHGLKFVEWLKQRRGNSMRGFPAHDMTEDGFDALVLRDDGTMETWDHRGGPVPITDPFWALGSGKEVALGALHAGATVRQAVIIACKVDSASSLPLEAVEVKPNDKKRARR